MKENKPEYQTEKEFCKKVDLLPNMRVFMESNFHTLEELLSRFKQHLIESGEYTSNLDHFKEDTVNKLLGISIRICTDNQLESLKDALIERTAVKISDEEMEHLWNVCPYNDARQSYKWMQGQLNIKK